MPNLGSIIPGFPTLQELPNTVAQAVNAGSVFDRESSIYNTTRFPARSSFESLLTAVNAVAKVEAPTPQGRNDSVVSHLDAQAAAAEDSTQTLSAPEFGIPARGDTDQVPEPSPTVGLGITQPEALPVSMELEGMQKARLSQGGEVGATLGGCPLVEANQPPSAHDGQDWDGGKRSDLSSTRRSPIPKHDQKALGPSVSPGPERKKQKV
jgi:hypothetical protein